MGNSAEEKRVLAVLEDVYRNHRYLSVPEEDGRLLRILTESIGAKHVVELGTSTGYSGLWILLALMRTGGRLTTYEIDRGRHELARSNYERAGLLTQATLILGDAHAEITKLKDPIDLVFIDADKEGYPPTTCRSSRPWCGPEASSSRTTWPRPRPIRATSRPSPPTRPTTPCSSTCTRRESASL